MADDIEVDIIHQFEVLRDDDDEQLLLDVYHLTYIVDEYDEIEYKAI